MQADKKLCFSDKYRLAGYDSRIIRVKKDINKILNSEFAGFPNNICLIGFMGTGKTEIGKLLAERLGFELIDTDELIADQAGKSIPLIFQEDGEDNFRKLEGRVLDSISEIKGKVISTGGGMPVGAGNLERLKKIGPVICLEASPEEIYERVKDCRDRPLLEVDNPLAKIKELLEAREPYYNQADFKVYSRTEAFNEIMQEIMEWLKEKTCR